MQSFYFLFFCVAIAFVIYWCLRNDDLADYTDAEEGKGDKKFKPGSKLQSGDDTKSPK